MREPCTIEGYVESVGDTEKVTGLGASLFDVAIALFIDVHSRPGEARLTGNDGGSVDLLISGGGKCWAGRSQSKGW